MPMEILKVVGQVAGLAGIALGVLLLIFRDVLRKIIAPQLTKEQAYGLLRLIIVLTWTVALAGMGVWAWVTIQSDGQPPARIVNTVFVEARRPEISGVGNVALEADGSFLASEEFVADGTLPEKLAEWIAEVTDRAYPEAHKDISISVDEAGNVEAPEEAISMGWFYRPTSGETESPEPLDLSLITANDSPSRREYAYFAYPFHKSVLLGPSFPASGTLTRTSDAKIVLRTNILGLRGALKEELSARGLKVHGEERIAELTTSVADARTLGYGEIQEKKARLDSMMFFLVVDAKRESSAQER